jgi:hypothetical protein
VRWNGSDRPTTFVSATRLTARIAAADVAAVGTAQVTVFTGVTGGGTSAPLTFTIAAPTLTTDLRSVRPGGTVTVTLTNGFGGALDWLALAAVGAADTSFLQWTYVGAGVTTRTWTVTLPTSGTYEFRLFLNDGFTRAATSPTVTIDTTVPVLSVLTPSRITTGAGAFTLTVDGSSFAPRSVVRWNGSDRPTTVVSSTRLTAAIAAADVAAAGTAQVTVFTSAPGGGTSAALPFTIAPPPTLTPDVTTVRPGGTVTVTLRNGFGGALDWIGLAKTTAPNNSFLLFTFVGDKITTRTWTVVMPTTPGTYEFRLFLDNGFVRVATSATVTVAP